MNRKRQHSGAIDFITHKTEKVHGPYSRLISFFFSKKKVNNHGEFIR